MPGINFFSEGIDFQPANKPTLKNWIKTVIEGESRRKINYINYIFCIDRYLLDINRRYLDHDFFTDIITFDESEDKKYIEADIFISIERVKENCKKEKVDFEKELHRVMIHGILHLLGYNDKNQEDQQKMREKENECLTLLQI